MSNKQNDIIKEERIEADRCYWMWETERDLKWALEATRGEPGLSIADIAKNIKKVFKVEELKILINNLKEI